MFINGYTQTLFDSVNASFKLTVESILERNSTNQSGNPIPLVYITNKGKAVLNANIYLVFAHKLEGNAVQPIYTSYPQLYKIRKAFNTMAELANDAFVKADGSLVVKSSAAEPVVIDKIGKAMNWMSLKFSVYEEGENGIIEQIPAVEINLSVAENQVSVLSLEEFLNVCEIINHIDLVQLQAQFSMFYLLSKESGNQNTHQTPGNYYQQNLPFQQINYEPQTGYNSGYGRSYLQQNRPQPAYNAVPVSQRRASNPSISRQTTIPQTQVVSQPQFETKTTLPQEDILPQREDTTKKIIDIDPDQVPTSEISFDDTAAIDDLFNE